MNALAKCAKCGSPILGNEWFCSNCGERVANAAGPAQASAPKASAHPLIWIAAALAALAALGAAGLYVAGRRIVRAADVRTDGALSRVARSVGTMDREDKRDASYGCGLLSKDDAAAISSTRITRTESQSDGCSYFGAPDPSLNPEAEAIRSMPGLGQNAQASKMIDQFAGAMRAHAEQQDPDARAGPGGERLLFAIHDSAALSGGFEAARSTAGTPIGGEAVAGIGDEAFFTAMHRMLFVRRGTRYLLIQPQFVKDPRGVAIAAARKILQ